MLYGDFKNGELSMEMELPQGALLQTGLPNIEFNEIFLFQTHS